MAFFIRKKKEENIQEIKDAVEGKKIPEQIEEKPEGELIQEIEEEMSGVSSEEIPEEMGETPVEESSTQEVVVSKKELITEPVAEITEIGKPSFAPLFVKLEKYKSVLETINELKSTIISIKNSLEIQRQIENLKNENRELLENAINKVDEKVLSLDSEFLRPKGFEEGMPRSEIKKESLQGVVSDLKKQIESLKEELKAIS